MSIAIAGLMSEFPQTVFLQLSADRKWKENWTLPAEISGTFRHAKVRVKC